MVKYIVEIPAARCIIPWKVAKRCSKDLEEMLAAFAEEWSKKLKILHARSQRRKKQKSEEQKAEVRRQTEKSEVRSQMSRKQKDKKVFRGSYCLGE